MVSSPRPPSPAPDPAEPGSAPAGARPPVPVTPGLQAPGPGGSGSSVSEPHEVPGTEESAAQPWRIKPVLPVTKGLGAVAVVVLVLAFGRQDPVQWVLAGLVAAGLAGWALRDLVAPVRLAADESGVTVVTGFAARHRVPWARVERLRVDRRERLGLTSSMLEVDTGDNLHLFTMHDLGADPAVVLSRLEELRAAYAP